MKNFLQPMLLFRAACFFFSFCSICFNATAQVTPAGSAVSANQTNTIASFTVPAGNKRVLIVTASDGAAMNITGASFNGTPMIKRSQVTDGVISVDAIFTLSLGDGATSTTGSIVFTSPNPTNAYKFISAAAFTKVNQAAPFSDIKSSFANTNNSSLTVTSTTGDLVFDIFDTWNITSSGSQVPGSGQTVVNTSGGLNFLGDGFGFYSTGRKAGAASVTTSWTAAGHFAEIHIAVNIKQDNAVLPLKLLSFTGAAKNNDALLNWATADEINVSHTEVERSNNGTDFSFVTRLDKTAKNYIDINALEIANGKLFYRLKMMDLDGNFNYSPIVVVQGKNKANFITGIQPLLSSGKIGVNFNLPQPNTATLLLSDISGNTVRKLQLAINKGTSTRYMEELQSLPAGVYVLQVICGEERVTQKLVK